MALKALHVVPVGDVIHEASRDCNCHPSFEAIDGNYRVVHNALDGGGSLEKNQIIELMMFHLRALLIAIETGNAFAEMLALAEIGKYIPKP